MHDFVVPTESFEVEQYVRVQLGDDRTEIGVVASIQKEQGMMTVTTRHGYDIDVRASAVHRAFLLVLDLNGVLVARGRGTYIHRPHAEEFVRFVFNNFAVAVWTSGLDRSSNPIIDSVLRGYQDRLLFTWYRESCTTRPTADNPFGTVKNLQRIFDAYPKSFHSVNTIIIDDSPDKCSHPDIALCPIPFQDPATQGSDDGLLRVMDVLREVLRCGTHEPLIRAAEERLEELRLQGGPKKKILFNAEDTAHSEQKQDADDDTDQCKLEEVKLWKTRLCCEFLCGACTYGDECRYSHDPDDGKRPCSRKQQCRHGHASRWARTEGDAIVGARRRQQNRFRDDTDYFLSKKELFDSQKNSKSHTGMPHLDAEIEGRGEDPHPAQGFVKKNPQQRKFPAQRSSENAPRHDMEFDNRANGGPVRKQRKNAPQSHTGMPHLDAEIEGRGEASHTTLTSMKKHPQQESHTGMPHLDAQIEGVHHSSHSLSPFSTNPSQQQFMFPSEAPQDSQRNSGSVLRFFGDSSLSPGNDTSKKNRKGQPPKANTHAQSVNRIELTGSATDGRDLLRQLQAFTSKK